MANNRNEAVTPGRMGQRLSRIYNNNKPSRIGNRKGEQIDHGQTPTNDTKNRKGNTKTRDAKEQRWNVPTKLTKHARKLGPNGSGRNKTKGTPIDQSNGIPTKDGRKALSEVRQAKPPSSRMPRRGKPKARMEPGPNEVDTKGQNPGKRTRRNGKRRRSPVSDGRKDRT